MLATGQQIAAHDAGADADLDAASDAATGAVNGVACAAGDDCQSGVCGQGGDGAAICCAVACGDCLTCEADGGACRPVAKGSSGPGCVGDVACDGTGSCKVVNGGPCPPDGGDAICLSLACAQGVCCTEVCPVCMACNADGSGCVNKPYGAHDSRCESPVTHGCDGLGKCFPL